MVAVAWSVLRNSNPRLPTFTVNTVIKGFSTPQGSEVLWTGLAENRQRAWEEAVQATPSVLEGVALPTGDSINVFNRVRRKKGSGKGSGKGGGKAKRQKASPNEESMLEAILAFFHQHPDRDLTAREVCDELGILLTTCTSRLNELNKAELMQTTDVKGKPLRYRLLTSSKTVVEVRCAYKDYDQKRRKKQEERRQIRSRNKRVCSLIHQFTRSQGDHGSTSEEVESYVLSVTTTDGGTNLLRHTIQARVSEAKLRQHLIAHPQGLTRKGKRHQVEVLVAGPLAELVAWSQRHPNIEDPDFAPVKEALRALCEQKGGIWAGVS